MADSKKSLLVHGSEEYVLQVFRFMEPRYEAPGRRGRKLPGEIHFLMPRPDLDIDGIGYKLLHNGEWFRFEGKSKTYDSSMNTIVIGYVY